MDLSVATLPGQMTLRPAEPTDCAELLVLQRCCWVQEALLNQTLDIPALRESFDEVQAWIRTWSVWCVRQGHRLVGAVRAQLVDSDWEIGRLMVAPDLSGQGLGRWLLEYAEAQAPADALRYVLFTGARSARNIRMYEQAGYRITTPAAVPTGHLVNAVWMVKPRARTSR